MEGPDDAVLSGAALPPGLVDAVDVLRGRTLTVRPLPGGLTNRNYRVDTDEASYVVRISDPGTGALAIDRDDEHRNSVIAASTGVGAPVHAYVPEASALVIGYIEGRTLTDADVGAAGTLERVAAACRRLHDGPRFVNDFDMFAVQAGYQHLVLDRGYRLPEGYLDHAPVLVRLREALAVQAGPTVACNNDLLAGNCIDDGTDVRLIDYEYAGNNDPCFELGNLACECHLSVEQLEHLVAAYFGAPRPDQVARARLFGLLGQYGWTLWASIQQATSTIDFDFWTWGMEKYEQAAAAFTGPELDGLLDAAAGCR